MQNQQLLHLWNEHVHANACTQNIVMHIEGDWGFFHMLEEESGFEVCVCLQWH